MKWKLNDGHDKNKNMFAMTTEMMLSCKQDEQGSKVQIYDQEVDIVCILLHILAVR